MPITLTAEEMAFLERVEGYCAAGLTQDDMAEREGVTLGGFRNRMLRCGFEVVSQTSREVTRLRTGERIEDLKQRGQLVVEVRGEEKERIPA